MKAPRILCWLVLAVCALSALSCSSSKGPSFDLLPAKQVGEDAEAERMRKMQLVAVLDDTTTGIDDVSGQRTLIALPQLVDLMSEGCVGGADCLTSCVSVCSAQYALCLAKTVLAITRPQGTVVKLGHSVIPQQTEATNTALATFGAGLAVQAAASAYDALGAMEGFSDFATGCDSPTSPIHDTTLAVYASGEFSDAFDTYKQLTDTAVSAAVNTSDAELNSSSSIALASQRAVDWRLLAARGIGGSADTLPFADNGAFCSRPATTPNVRAAIAVFRDAAPSPFDMLDASLSTQVLLDGSLSTGSVRQRLAQFYGNQQLANGGNGAIEQRYNLDLSSFEDARAFLKEEITAFSRSSIAVLPTRVLPDGSLATYSTYAATAARPSALPAAFYGALARQAGPTLVDGGLFAFTSYSTIYSGFISAATKIVAHGGTLPDSIRDTVLSQPSLMLSNNDVIAYVYSKPNVVNGQLLQQIFVHGFSTRDGIRLAFGEDQLRCAVQGSIEGAACTPNLRGFEEDEEPGTSFAVAARADVPFPNPVSTRVYLLKPRVPPSNPDDPYADSVVPGGYEALGGFTMSPLFGNGFAVVRGNEERIASILEPSRDWCARPHTLCDGSSFDERIALENELTDDSNGFEDSWRHYLDLAKSAAAEADLLGTDYINSSLAKGQNLQSNEERKEQQLEYANAQLEQLQQLCGFTSDTRSLLKLLSDENGNVINATSGACPPVCGAGYKCIHSSNDSGTCTLDLNAFLKLHDRNPDIKRIEDCLSAGGIEPFVSLGDLPLCLWHDHGNPNIVCQGVAQVIDGKTVRVPVPSGHCPQILPRAQVDAKLQLADPDAERAREIAACNAVFAADAKLTNVKPSNATTALAKPLGYFAVSGAADDKPTQDLYKKLRRIDPSTFSELVDDGFISKNLLDPNRLVETINGLDWESRFDGHAAIKFLGTAIYETGVGTKAPNPSTIPDPMNPMGSQVAAPWPCGTGHDEIDLTDKRPWLGASTGRPASYDCTTVDGRANAVKEMFAAVAAAKLLGPLADDQLYDFDGNGFPLIPFASIQQDEVLRPMIVHEHHWWFIGASLDPAGVFGNHSPVDVDAPIYACGTFAFKGQASTKSCDSSRSLLRPDGSSVLQSTCQTGTAFTVVNGGQTPYGDVFANLGCFQAMRLHAAEHATTDDALRGLSSSVPSKFEGFPTGWMPRYLRSLSASLSDKVATYTWESSNEHVPGGTTDRKLDLTGEDLLMGLSLITKSLSQAPKVSFDHPPEVKTVDDLEAVSLYVEALSDQISNGVSSLAFANMPTRVADALRMESANGAYSQFGGDMAVQISAARGALIKIHDNGPLIANEVKQMGVDIRELKIILRKSAINQDIADLQFASQLSNQLTSCALSLTHFSIDPIADGAAAAGAAITCANSIAQIGFASSLTDLAKQNSVLDGELAIADFGGKFSSHATAMQTLASQLAGGEEDLDGALATIEGKRSLARSTLVNALSAASFQAQHQAEVSNVLANLSDGKQRRYQVALKNAKHLAFVAKRAIEQRLGVQLATITEDYPLVEAPSKWESTVCTLTGLDYAKLTAANPKAPQSFANGFIGDYVTKLENFVESYTLQQNFHEGTDTAVISLRDDIMNVRKPCATKGPNLLLDAGQLTASIGWYRENCPTQDVGDGVTQPVSDCINVNPRTDGPIFADSTAARAAGYSLVFGSASTVDSALVQSVDLPGGRFRFTWYTKEGGGAGTGIVRSDAALQMGKSGIVPATTDGWNRRYMIFRLAAPAAVRVGFKVNGGSTTISAPMLEQIPDTDEDLALVPFVNTIRGLTEVLPACEDSTGSVFRSSRWKRNCTKLCADGFADNCGSSNSREYCYWEADFGFSQRDIQLGKVFNFSGFARGNFNYRIDSLGINFVGTGTRDCATSDFPQTCFGSGSIPYSLEHTGPFFVRNFRGDDVETRVFDGNIEHARGLAAERYLTNPLSDSDNSLIKQYLRGEFSGRPLDGNFILRIWDEDGVDFSALQDVQLILNYRYWTKFN